MSIAEATALFRDTSQLIEESLKQIDLADQKSVIVIGETGVGKSTLIHLLAGVELRAVYDDKIDRTYIEAAKALSGILIGHGGQSKTSIPHKWKDKTGIAYWDCPGFIDNRGEAQEIANAVCIKRVFETSRFVKIVIVVRDADLMVPRPTSLMTLVRRIDELFGENIHQITRCMSLVVSHAPQEREEKHIKAILSTAILELGISGTQKMILESLIHNPEVAGDRTKIKSVGKKTEDLMHRLESSPISLFKASGPDGNQSVWRREISARIHQAQYVENLRVNISLSAECKISVLQSYNFLIGHMRQEINRLMHNFKESLCGFASKSQDKALLKKCVLQLSTYLEKLEMPIATVILQCIEIAKECGVPLQSPDTETLDAIHFLEQLISRGAQIPVELRDLIKEQMTAAKETLEFAILTITIQEAKLCQRDEAEKAVIAQRAAEEAIRAQNAAARRF